MKTPPKIFVQELATEVEARLFSLAAEQDQLYVLVYTAADPEVVNHYVIVAPGSAVSGFDVGGWCIAGALPRPAEHYPLRVEIRTYGPDPRPRWWGCTARVIE